MKFYIFSHTPFHHLQVCQILANSESEIIEDNINGLEKLPYAKLLVEAHEDLFDLMDGLPGISIQDFDQDYEDI